MSYLFKVIYGTVLLSISYSTTHAAGINAELGMWEWTTTMEIPGMPFAPPPVTYSECLTKEDLVPNQSGRDGGCKIISQKITGSSIHWKMECVEEGQKMTSEGKMIYSGTTAKGEVNIVSQGMKMKSKINGHRTGACK